MRRLYFSRDLAETPGVLDQFGSDRHDFVWDASGGVRVLPLRHWDERSYAASQSDHEPEMGPSYLDVGHRGCCGSIPAQPEPAPVFTPRPLRVETPEDEIPF